MTHTSLFNVNFPKLREDHLISARGSSAIFSRFIWLGTLLPPFPSAYFWASLPCTLDCHFFLCAKCVQCGCIMLMDWNSLLPPLTHIVGNILHPLGTDVNDDTRCKIAENKSLGPEHPASISDVSCLAVTSLKKQLVESCIAALICRDILLQRLLSSFKP